MSFIIGQLCLNKLFFKNLLTLHNIHLKLSFFGWSTEIFNFFFFSFFAVAKLQIHFILTFTLYKHTSKSK